MVKRCFNPSPAANPKQSPPKRLISWKNLQCEEVLPATERLVSSSSYTLGKCRGKFMLQAPAKRQTVALLQPSDKLQACNDMARTCSHKCKLHILIYDARRGNLAWLICCVRSFATWCFGYKDPTQQCNEVNAQCFASGLKACKAQCVGCCGDEYPQLVLAGGDSKCY